MLSRPCLACSTITSAFSASAPTQRWQRATFDTLAIHAGSPHMLFLDDHPYPFKPNPHFKLWVPLEDAVDCWLVYRPGEKPRLIFLQPADYWHKPPVAAARLLDASLPDRGDPRAGRCPPPPDLSDLGRCAFIGEWQEQFKDWGFAESNPEALLHRLHYPRAVKTDVRAGVHAPRVARGRARACRCRSCLPRRQVGIRNSHGLRARDGTFGARAALLQHRRAQHERGGPALSAPGARGAGEALLVPDRRGRAVPHVRGRRHAHVRCERRRLRGADRRHGVAAVAAVLAGSQRRRLREHSPRCAFAHRRSAARRGRHHDVGSGCGDERPVRCVLPARRRPPARPASARRRGLQRRREGHAEGAARRVIRICGSRARSSPASS